MPRLLLRTLLVAAALCSTAALAQTWPARPIRIIIGQGLSGATGVVTRLETEELGKLLGQSFIVESRPGASSSIAAHAVKDAPPDGYTLFVGDAPVFSSLYLKSNSLDASRELQPVSIMVIGDHFVIVRADLGVSSLAELAAKARLTRLKHASPSPTQHPLMAVVAKRLKFDYDNIPYKTTDQAVVALLSGDADFMLNSLAGSTPYIQSGKFKALATLGPTRSPLMPDVPTARELGADFEVRFHLGMWAPLGTAPDVVKKLSNGLTEVTKLPVVSDRIKELSMVATGSTPDELLRVYQSELQADREANALVGLQPQ
jgi:tripartite-type tricarboxylate transporter receptor subunit TctC